ncbi:MAG: hypothetical protein ABSG41_23800 [Bryobacteraceae bacterium]|jgi:hypothetical protein
MDTEKPTAILPQPLLWLHDAPLFIDEAQIERFYDAVVRPLSKQGVVTMQVTEANADELKSKFNLEASVTTEKLAGLLLPVLAFFKPEFKASGEVEANTSKTRTDGSSFQFIPIDNPQRQLEQLTIHYLFNHPNRLFLPRALGACPSIQNRHVITTITGSRSLVGTQHMTHKMISRTGS